MNKIDGKFSTDGTRVSNTVSIWWLFLFLLVAPSVFGQTPTLGICPGSPPISNAQYLQALRDYVPCPEPGQEWQRISADGAALAKTKSALTATSGVEFYTCFDKHSPASTDGGVCDICSSNFAGNATYNPQIPFFNTAKMSTGLAEGVVILPRNYDCALVGEGWICRPATDSSEKKIKLKGPIAPNG